MNTDTKTTATREDYLSCFGTTNDAVEYEDQVLSAGRDYLPPCAVAVLDGGDATPDYWAWLITQVE